VRQREAGRRVVGSDAVRVRGRRAAGAAAVAAAAAAAAAAIAVVGPSGGASAARGTATTAGALATVGHGVLTTQVSSAGTIGHVAQADGSPWALVNQAAGVYTRLPRAGAVKRCGATVYRVDDQPVLLLCGHTPLYRTLSTGMSGPDVEELNRMLVDLGYADGDNLDPNSDDFTWRTAAALRALQDDRGADETGMLAPADAVVAPGRVRVSKLSATLGTAARPGGPMGLATSTRRQVELDLDASDAAGVSVGDRATVTLPDNTVARGRVTEVGTVATTAGAGTGADTTAKLPVHIALDDRRKAAGLDQAPVQVQITTARVKDALSVPVTALIAQAGGGYAVEVASQAGAAPRRVPVQLGLFDHDQGLVQVTGDGLAAGQRVVIPAS
jgi:hypothetical protein